MIQPTGSELPGMLGSITTLPIHVVYSLRRAASESENELCGYITNKFDIIYVKNVHPEPKSNFLMDLQEHARAIELVSVAEERIIGVFHTHPSGALTLSENDKKGFPAPELGWKYFIVTKDAVVEYFSDVMDHPIDQLTGVRIR